MLFAENKCRYPTEDKVIQLQNIRNDMQVLFQTAVHLELRKQMIT